MDDLVNALPKIEKNLQGSGIVLVLEGGRLLLKNTHSTKIAADLRVQRLYRPSSEDIEQAAAADSVLVITAPTQKATKTAARYNYITLPDGGYRIIAPGVAISWEQEVPPRAERRSVKLRGLTGVVAETLLLERKKVWSVRALADASAVSVALAHRVLTRLDGEGITSSLKGDRKLVNARALAELWSQEESKPQVLLKGFVYGGSNEAVAKKLLGVEPNVAIGGVVAANSYHPVLTRVTAPVRLWTPSDPDTEALHRAGFESTESGANVEFVRSKGNPWRVKMTEAEGLQRVSPWRAWVEIASSGGRTQELADEFIEKLLKEDEGG